MVANKVTQKCRIDQPLTVICYLNDELANKLISKTEKACIQVANAMQPRANDDFEHAFEHSMCFPTMMERPKVKTINSGGD